MEKDRVRAREQTEKWINRGGEGRAGKTVLTNQVLFGTFILISIKIKRQMRVPGGLTHSPTQV